MKLTADLIEQSAQYTNPATKDREISFRGYKISEIENLGATLDQFDCIDFTDNDIRRLENFPLLKRLKRLLLSNNRVQRISDDLHEQLPSLESIVLINNELQQLGDINPLAACKNLHDLALINNPLTTKEHYRLFAIHRLPQLKTLDFRRIRLREREAARTLFKGKKGKQLEQEIGIRSKVFSNTATGQTNGDGNSAGGRVGSARPHTADEVTAIKAAIDKATTLEEIERLNALLKQGFIPGQVTADAREGGGQTAEERLQQSQQSNQQEEQMEE